MPMDHALIMDAGDGDAADAVIPTGAQHALNQEQDAQAASDARSDMAAVMTGSLAPELLARIFYVVADNEGAFFNHNWTRLMIVSRHFREVGLAHSELWSYVMIPNLRRRLPAENAAEYYAARIERAGGWPLSVSVRYGREAESLIGTPDAPLWNAVIGNLMLLSIGRDSSGRVLGTSNWNPQSSLQVFLEHLASQGHPRLQYFTLNPDRYGQAYIDEVSHLLSVSAVRHAHLGLIPRTGSENLPYLTSISLSLPSPNGASDIMFTLLELLRCCPALRSLAIAELQGSYRNRGENLPYPPNKVSLPILRSFDYHGDLLVANTFLQSVVLPNAERLSLKLLSIDTPSDSGIEQLAINLKNYILCSPSAAAGAQTLHAYEHHFSVSALRGGQDVTTVFLDVGDKHLDPDLDIEHIFVTLLPAFLSVVPLACIDSRFKRLSSRVAPLLDPMNASLLGTPTLPATTDGALLALSPDKDAWLTLDVLRMLLPVTDIRIRILHICIDLSRLKDEGFELEYVQQLFTRVCEHLRDVRAVGKTLDTVEVLHSAATKDKDGLVPLDVMRSLVMGGVMVDGGFYKAT